MSIRRTTARTAAAALGLALAGVGALTSTAAADDDTGIDVSVTIEDLTPPGVLAMSVAANDGVTLTEDGSDASARQFVGTLPTVTVSDSRTSDEIPAGAFWAVVGQASAFTGNGVEPLGPEYLGWAPRLLTPSSEGSVAAGDPVSSVIEDGSGSAAVGLEGQELLVSTWASGSEPGPWDVTADLALRVPTDTPAGDYTSVITLSLFEGQ